MNSAHTGKRCRKCGTQFRGTAKKEELCARCDVMGCEVPDDINEQFEQLAMETYGQNYQSLLPVSDVFSHKTRLSKLEKEIEQCNTSSQEKIRKKREIVRMREEIVAKEDLMESIKSKMLKICLAQNNQKKKSVSTTSTPCYSTPTYSPKRSPVSNKSSPVKWSPVKTTPQPGTSRSPKSHAKVTFAIRPRKSEEVNNNVPVTASSSSDEEGDDKKETPVLLTRSNSVRDRVKAFEDLGRRHSTSSYDAKKKMVSRNLTKSFNAVFS
ncbi:hypothetical protein Ocin01_03544 [Orchesella cincta]|uniref:Uncharacterized protein n=1 Tax=Orchesella cincta TaxID=48709 RepID=A0A1D2ND21_ORCCI|nr:hypothetical protein Ocin01_03544 [Orchesella cincta]